MKNHYSTLVFLIVLFALASVCAHAAVVTVSPENMGAWSIAVNAGGFGALANYGPAVNEAYKPFQTGGGFDFGKGSFYASCTYAGSSGEPSDKTPSTVWLGTDQHKGQSLAGKPLSSITKMQYYSFMSKIPTRFGSSNTSNWDSWTWWRYPKQPITLQLTVIDPGGSGIRRTFCYRPWGTSVMGDDLNENAIGVWQHFDCKASGRWMMHPDWDGNPETAFENWDAVIASYGNWLLIDTNTDPSFATPGWKGTTIPPGRPYCTATGKCLNFEVGARFVTNVWPGATSPSNWWTESVGFRGHVDYFTLGIDNVDETYNFEPSEDSLEPPIVATTCKGLSSAFALSEETQKLVMFKVVGKVVTSGNLSGNPWAEIDDGSGVAPVRIYNVDGLTNVGSYISAWGYAERPRWTTVPTPIIIWCDVSHQQELYHVPDIF